MATQTPITTRFAPSPTGFLHLGHVYAAKEAFGFAKQHNGACLLRIEDIDHTRCKSEFLSAICKNLDWLGFNWPEPVRIQSQHRQDYDGVIDNLRERGLVYRCFKTRKDLPKGLYRGRALAEKEEYARLADDKPFAWRLSIQQCLEHINAPLTYEETGIDAGVKTVDLKALSDEVLVRKDIGTSYHIACCHDDALQNISHIVRGQDIAPLTSVHRLLQHLMDWPVPIYHHHALLMDNSGEKLSKRKRAASILSLREQGFTAAQVLDMASPWVPN